jgi:hypothetical protein
MIYPGVVLGYPFDLWLACYTQDEIAVFIGFGNVAKGD